MEQISVNAEHENFVDSNTSQNQTGPRCSDRRFYGAVVLCSGLLNIFLLVGLGFGVHYQNLDPGSAADFSILKINLTQCLQASNNKLSHVSEERDQLNVRLSSLTAERDQLNVRLSSLTAEREQLNVSLTEMTKELNRLQSSSEHKTCPAGWRMFSFSCYFISCKSGSWERGRQDCKDREADLVVIDTAEEQTFLSYLTAEETWGWIGLTDREEEGTWRWIDGASLTLSYWEEEQPDNGGGDIKWGEEDCAHIRTGKKTEENWNDRSCDASLRWICEKKAQY